MWIVIAVFYFSFLMCLFLELDLNQVFNEMGCQLNITHHIHHAYFHLVFDVRVLDFLNYQHFLVYFLEELQPIAEAKLT